MLSLQGCRDRIEQSEVVGRKIEKTYIQDEIDKTYSCYAAFVLLSLRGETRYVGRTMKKIPTIFKRDKLNNGKIINEYAVDVELFLYATATEKLDGMNVRVTVRNHTPVRLEKRRNPDKIQKHKGIIEPWYVDTSQSSEDKWLNDALKNTDFTMILDGEWIGEAVGSNIQGNPLHLMNNRIMFFTLSQAPQFENVPTNFEELKEWLPKQKSKYGNDCGIEGIVWHLPDGNMMKIKTKDFN